MLSVLINDQFNRFDWYILPQTVKIVRWLWNALCAVAYNTDKYAVMLHALSKGVIP